MTSDPRSDRHAALSSSIFPDQRDRGVEGDALKDLLGSPRRVRIGGHVSVQDAPSLEREYEEHVQYIEGRGRHGQKVDGGRAGEMCSQERARRRRRWLSWLPVGSGIRSHRMCDKPTKCDLSDDALALLPTLSWLHRDGRSDIVRVVMSRNRWSTATALCALAASFVPL